MICFLTQLAMFFLVGSSSTGSDVFVKMNEQFGLFFFANEEGQELFGQVDSCLATPDNNVCRLSGLGLRNSDILTCRLRNEINGAFVTHSDFNGRFVLVSDATKLGLKSGEMETTFSIKKTGKVSCGSYIHTASDCVVENVQRLSLTGVGPSGPKRTDTFITQMKVCDIVFSSLKDEAAAEPVKAAIQGSRPWVKTKTFSAGDYFAIGRPTTFRTLKNDLESLHQYVDAGFRMIMNGEIGRYEGVRFVEQTNIASQAWTNSKSDTVHFFGEDTVAEAIACPEEMRGKIPGDYGRDKGVAWYALGGFGIVHGNADNARIVRWTSAA